MSANSGLEGGLGLEGSQAVADGRVGPRGKTHSGAQMTASE